MYNTLVTCVIAQMDTNIAEVVRCECDNPSIVNDMGAYT